MPEPTPAEIEAGAKALERLVAEHPRADRRTIARWVLRAVLPDHDARVRANERARVAEEIDQHLQRIADHLRDTGQILPDKTTAELIEAFADVAHVTTPTTKGDPDAT